MSYQHPRRGCIDIIFVTITIFNPDLYYGTMIIDAHIHIWHRDMIPDRAIENYLEPLKKLKGMYGGVFDIGLDEEIPFADYKYSMSESKEMLDACKMDHAVVLGTDFELVNEHRMTNDEYMDWLFEICSTDDRYIPFISVDPNKGEDALRSVERVVKKYAPKGIKVYPATGFYPDDPKYDAYWDLIDDLGLVITTHAGMALPPLDEKYCHPKFFDRIAEKHPDMKIIIAHLGGKFHDELFPLMDAHDNVYTDCSALQGWIPVDPTMVDRRLEEVSSRYPDRVVFGSDSPLYNERTTVQRYMDIIMDGKWGTRKVKEDILGNNMARILGI